MAPISRMIPPVILPTRISSRWPGSLPRSLGYRSMVKMVDAALIRASMVEMMAPQSPAKSDASRAQDGDDQPDAQHGGDHISGDAQQGGQ